MRVETGRRAGWVVAAALCFASGCVTLPERQSCTADADCAEGRCDLAIGRCVASETDAGVQDAAARADTGRPDARVVPPDAAVSSTDAAATTPDAAVATPDAAVSTPDAAVSTPDAAPPDPDVGPDAAPPCPDPVAEVCNDADDDCDGEIDEDFDLQSDPANCGRCGAACMLPDAVNLCVAGTCTFARCLPGHFDRDNDPETGCEQVFAGSRAWWVDDDAAPGGNGDQLTPFQTVDAAVDVAGPGDQIWVEAGTYTPAEAPDQQSIRIQAVEPGTVTFQVGNGRLRFGVNSELVDIDIDLLGGSHSTGVEIAAGAGVIGCRIHDANNSNGGDGNPIVMAAVRITGRGGRLIDTVVERITETTDPATIRPAGDCRREAPRAANTIAGVFVENVDDARIIGNTFRVLRGGSPAPSGVGAGCGTPVAGAPGGVTNGIALRSADRTIILRNVIQDIQGGRGSDDLGLGYPGIGGTGIGVNIYGASTGTVMRYNRILRMAGGPQGNVVAGSARFVLPRTGKNFGVYINPDSLDQDIDMSNTVDGDPVIYVYGGANPAPIENCRLTAASWPHNWGKIAVMNSSGVRISNCVLSNLTGGPSGSPGFVDGVWAAPNAVSTAAVQIRDSADVVLEGLQVEHIRGGVGGPSLVVPRVGAGGVAHGVVIVDSTQVEVRDSAFSFIDSPAEGELPFPARSCQGPGETNAVRAMAVDTISADIRLVRNTYHHIGQANPCPDVPALATASRAFDTSGLTSRGELIYALGGAGTRCVGVNLRGNTTGADIDGLTYAAGPDCVAETSASVEYDATGTLAITNALLEAPLSNPQGAPRNITMSYSLVPADALAGLPTVATVGMGVIGGEPGFTDPESADFTLAPDSIGVDSGDPMDDCELEPEDPDDMCRVDLGHTGNTPAARAVEGR
jgi:hypothetical protein